MFNTLIIGNIFSFMAAVCLAISVVRKDKKGLIGWQIGDTVCCTLSNWFLQSYSAMIISIICIVRNILAYHQRLGQVMTIILMVVGAVIGLWANNRGYIGWLPVLASAEYTVCMYRLGSAQGMRYALVINLLMWLVHDAYIQSYPMAAMDLILTIWTAWQAWRNRQEKA